MPRKKPITASDVEADAPLVLKSPPRKAAKKASRSSAKAMHKRTRKVATVAELRMVEGVGFVLDVNDVLTKNERYNHIIIGTSRKLGGKGQRAAPVPSPAAVEYKEAVKLAAVKCCGAAVLLGMGIRIGIWRLEVLSIWPTERHHADGTNTANGDSDASIAMVKDAMQHAGIIDDDMRIVGETTCAIYQKGIRRTVAILRPIAQMGHEAWAASMLAVLG